MTRPPPVRDYGPSCASGLAFHYLGGRLRLSVRARADLLAATLCARSYYQCSRFCQARGECARRVAAAGSLPKQAFTFGNRIFNTNWVVAPTSVDAFDGLGPVFNRVSCSGCHTRDGRGQPPNGPADTLESILLRQDAAAALGPRLRAARHSQCPLLGFQRRGYERVGACTSCTRRPDECRRPGEQHARLGFIATQKPHPEACAAWQRTDIQ